MVRSRAVRWLAFGVVLAAWGGCTNNPYPSAWSGENAYYSSFAGPPKHLDPAISYSSDEYVFITQIYEPPFEYHFLKRPYELVPLTAEAVPRPEYFDKAGNKLGEDPPAEEVARAVYTIRIRRGILYQDHPCFAKNPAGGPAYLPLAERDVADIERVEDLPLKGSRALRAHDYVWQIKRLAHPALDCPILSLLTRYVEGLEELHASLKAELDRIREERRRRIGALYNQELDEKENPIFLDLDRFPLAGAEVVDDTTYRIALKTKYPQMLYWLAMPFFSPVPPEADRFFAQAPLLRRNIKLDNSPLGTGAYRIETYAPNKEIILTRNENYRGDPYPSEGDPEDAERGWLLDAGKPLPLTPRAVYKLEKEFMPRWGKFLQGYYDLSGLNPDVFDLAVTMAQEGLGASEEMKAKGIYLTKEVNPTLYYLAFNMDDEVVGGTTPEKKKLRQAIAIAINAEEFIQIFRNGRDVPAHGPIPPGIFGYAEGREGMNSFAYGWDEARGAPARKSIEEAKRLLAEAGYPGGRDRDGRPLVLHYDATATSAADNPTLTWLRKQFGKIDIDLQIRATDYTRFRDKARTGNFQILSWGWHADYPDPENFMFLLYGPNGKAKFGGENAANYDSPEFNELFRRMETMANGPEREKIILEMTRIFQEDVPWIPRYFLVDYILNHSWYSNAKAMGIGGGSLKYRKVDPALRQKRIVAWNAPIQWPLFLLALGLGLAILPAWRTIRRRELRSAVER